MIDLYPDPLHEVRVAKRWALAGIGAAVAFLLPAYALLLGVGVTEVAFIVAPAAIAGFVGIEMGSRWEYRMRRRYAYPQRLGYQMAAVHDLAQAGQRGAELIAAWLQPRSLVVAWLDEEARELRPIGASGLSPAWLSRAAALPLGNQTLGEALKRGNLFPAVASSHPWFGDVSRQGLVTAVPLIPRDVPEGVLVICAAKGNSLVGDGRLLAAFGLVMGLALENARLYDAQRAYTRRLQDLNRMKSDFLSTVSHELRTPLTSIMMAGEMFLEEEESRDPNSTRGRLVSNIVKGATRLSGLVSDLVNVSREDEFQPRLELDAVPLADVVQGAVSIIQPLLTAKHQSIEIALEAEDALVMVDRLRFDQVLVNLLSNAQRYSPAGGHIRVSSSLGRDEVVIRVTDSGPGVADEDRELIFEPFYRGDRSGLGLGLAIAKSLVELHSGRIWVESENGKGSTFCVALPTHANGSGRSQHEPAAVR